MRLTAQHILAVVEPLIYGRRARRICVWLLALGTLLCLWQAAQTRPGAEYENSLPLGHPYIQVFKQYQSDFGGANTVLVALLQKPGGAPDIYNEKFLGELKAATEEVFFMAGIDRAHVSSIFTRNVRYLEVVDGGFIAGDVIPAEYAPTPEMFALIRRNVAKAQVLGSLVSVDQRGAMISAEVLEHDPVSGRRIDPVRLSHTLEDDVRGRFTSPKKYVYRLKRAVPPFQAGEAVAETFETPDWTLWFRHVEAGRRQPDGDVQRYELSGRDLTVETQDNPQYNPDISVHIIGFTKVTGDVTDAALQVLLFFGLTVLATMLALWWYLGSLRLALLPLCCSVVAVIWEFGLLHLLGYGVDPFAIMVPFLVLAVSTSHGVQYVNTWADEVVHGRDGFEASRATFRRLFIPGSIALLTNVAGFLTIYLVPIGSVRDMSINACLGMFAVIVTNKGMMPIWLSYLSVADVDTFRRKRLAKIDAGDRLWRALSAVTEKPVAAALILLSLLVLGGSWAIQTHRIVGDATTGVPELRPDSRYNRDFAAVTSNFSIGTDILKLITETAPETCAQYDTLEQIDTFAWRMSNVEGVQSVKSIATVVRQAYLGLMDLDPKFNVLPHNGNVLSLINQDIQTTSGLLDFHCAAMPVFVFTADHRAATIDRVIDAAKRFNARNAGEFYAAHPEVKPAACDTRIALRRDAGLRRDELQRYTDLLHARGMSDEAIAADPRAQALQQTAGDAAARYQEQAQMSCPANFAIGSGNIGVMAAANEVVEAKELPTVLAVYAVIVLLMLISYRSPAGLLAICIPLFMVSIFANALMALFGIGLKVATLPVVSLAVGVGVDYGIYIYDVLQEKVQGHGLNLREGYFQTLHQTGKAVIFTGVCLAGGVSAWLFSELQFQRDMGKLLVFMFGANMLGAVLLCPAYYRFLARTQRGG
ncbi:MAG: MMPL family transporter [Nevskia sp.]|nr:MMPL family transporter [Nevskia sp.]